MVESHRHLENRFGMGKSGPFPCSLCIYSFYFILLIDGGWTSWSSNGICSQTCGGGTLSRYRYCQSPLPFNTGNLALEKFQIKIWTNFKQLIWQPMKIILEERAFK